MKDSTIENLAKLEKIITQKTAESKNRDVSKLAEQAIASMRDTVRNNQAVMAEISKLLAKPTRPKEFLVQRDTRDNITKIIPVYEDNK